ncbi:MAG: serine/threonine protein kinase, partial [Gemmatimonadetes bacterium]|nr:serine/threonine protein kinase [Gemmatimonadota bacterium]
GGMGDVYRADDLTLGQSVALKFLPESLQADADRRRRFLNEVRTAREVAHPNVCRVYDFGEVEGRSFLSMEYVDGEDLAALLRRIGRIPQEKGVEIARQLCAGLGALHDRGVLHRDLKPANVMLDGRGRVRLTDFGLAGADGAITGAEARAGTPAYMAPEQLAGERADVRSDLWALGLVLYEIFTGKRAFEADSIADLARRQRETTPTSVTTLLPDLDPAIERVIARCLDPDPARRPASAFAVAAALPGGDPLAAALAAGEVPSVEMVAAAGAEHRVKPILVVLSSLCVLLGLLLTATLVERARVTHWDPMEKPTSVLQDRAREILGSVGLEATSIRQSGFWRDGGLLSWIAKNDSSADRWDVLRTARPPAVAFWYRQSVTPMIPYHSQGGVRWDDPPNDAPGMARLTLDTKGRLILLSVVPPDRDTADSTAVEPDYAPLFAAAGLDPADFVEVPVEWTPEHETTSRKAWVGEWKEWPGHEIRIEAGAWNGAVSSWETIGPWRTPREPDPKPRGTGDIVMEAALVLMILSLLVIAVFLAVRNVRLGRGDRRGATRLAIAVFGTSCLIFFLVYEQIPDPSGAVQKFLDFCSQILLVASLFWAFYLALEPYVRKTMPERLVSWSRLLTGRWRDPLVGRDILVGGMFFLVLAAADVMRAFLPQWTGHPAPRPDHIAFDALNGVLPLIGSTLAVFVNSTFSAMLSFLFLVLLRITVKNVWVSQALYVVGFVLFLAFNGPDAERLQRILVAVPLAVAFLVVQVRFGLLAFLVGFVLSALISDSGLSLDGARWYAGIGHLRMFVVLLILGWGIWAARGGRASEEPSLPLRRTSPTG